jgi:hypothetical protein
VQWLGSWLKNGFTKGMLNIDTSCGRSHHGFSGIRSKTKQTSQAAIFAGEARLSYRSIVSRRNSLIAPQLGKYAAPTSKVLYIPARIVL